TGGRSGGPGGAFRTRDGGAGKPRSDGGGDRPARAFKPRDRSDAPRDSGPRRERDGDRPARTFKPRDRSDAPRDSGPRRERDGDRPARTFKPRDRSDAPRESGPRRERDGDRPARTFKPRDRSDAPRDSGPRRERDGDRPARTFKPRDRSDAPRDSGPRRERDGDRPARAFKPRDRSDAPRDSGPRRERDGDRPARTFKPREQRDDRAEKPEGDFKPWELARAQRAGASGASDPGSAGPRSSRQPPGGRERPDRGERPVRDGGDRSTSRFRPRERDDRPYGDRPGRGSGDRAARGSGDRSGPQRTRDERPRTDRPRQDGERRPFVPRGDRPDRAQRDGDRSRDRAPGNNRGEGRPAFSRGDDRPRPQAKPALTKRPKAAPPSAMTETWTPGEPVRIAKAMARAGLCSRRDAERWIADGRVSVNGRKISSPALDVSPTDKVIVDGVALPAFEPPRLWRYHKPRGLVTTHHDPEGRPTVFDRLPPEMPRVVSVGRLDFNTEGLLLLTNDGALARHLELPATGWLRRYKVRAHGSVTQEQLDTLQDGITVEGVAYGPVEARLGNVQGANLWLEIGLREGKNREVRRILATFGLDVNRLIRISYGPFQLRDLEPGAVDQVKRRVLADQLGREIVKDLGLDDVAEAARDRRERARDASRAARKATAPSPGDAEAFAEIDGEDLSEIGSLEDGFDVGAWETEVIEDDGTSGVTGEAAERDPDTSEADASEADKT
ncbi:MAG: pseudouridine synthase, partial [Hyphomicrobiaceae bacterium]|nr:pseudouridine synthase [Hyphomicrobiaceae bacterium]